MSLINILSKTQKSKNVCILRICTMCLWTYCCHPVYLSTLEDWMDNTTPIECPQCRLNDIQIIYWMAWKEWEFLFHVLVLEQELSFNLSVLYDIILQGIIHLPFYIQISYRRAKYVLVEGYSLLDSCNFLHPTRMLI